MPGGAVDIDANIGILDLDVDVVVGLRQDDDLRSRGVDASVGLGNGNALHAVCTALVLHTAVRAAPLHNEGDVLDTALSRFVAIQDFDFPAFAISVAAVHAEQFAREQ